MPQNKNWLNGMVYTFVLAICVSMVSVAMADDGTPVVEATGDVVPTDPATWDSGTDAYVGKTGSGTLNIAAGGEVNSNQGYLGYESGSSGEVTVTGSDSAWTNSDVLHVGLMGSGLLEILDGGSVSNNISHIGYNDIDSLGKVIVDGPGSSWTNNGALYISGKTWREGEGGFEGTGEGMLTITNGGTVSSSTLFMNGKLEIASGGVFSSGYCRIGFGYDADLQSEVTVDGAGSKLLLNEASLFTVGENNNAKLTITNGGEVMSNSVYVSSYFNVHSEIVVDGTDSKWVNEGALRIGHSGTAEMSVTHGGYVHSLTGYVGHGSVVDVIGSTWANSADFTNSGTLNITEGGQVDNNNGHIGYNNSLQSIVTVDGVGSKWTNRGDLHFNKGRHGELNITHGGEVIVAGETWTINLNQTDMPGTIYFDNGTLTTGSLVGSVEEIIGTGTIYTRSLVGDFDVTLDATHGLKQTFTINEKENQNITVHLDSDGNWPMRVGYLGAGTLRVSDAIAIASPDGYIGYASDAVGEVTINGVGSKWTNGDDLYVGYNGKGTLNITDHGKVSNKTSYIGYYPDSQGTVTVDGAGSTWTNDGDIYIGGQTVGRAPLNSTDGDANGAMDDNAGMLMISGGGQVISRSGYLGYRQDSVGAVAVDGAGSSWIMNGEIFYVGEDGSGTLTITDGAHVFSRRSYVGSYRDGESGTVAVDGAGSLWTNTRSEIGYKGRGSLSISNGGIVKSDVAFVGYDSDSTGEATVDGIDSTWKISDALYVGLSGNGTLHITGGGQVSSGNGRVGGSADSTGEVTVDGTDSIWANSGDIKIGTVGQGALTITNGGVVNNEIGYIGYDHRNSGEVIVDGAGSTWINRNKLHVGHNHSNDNRPQYDGLGTLNVTNQGTVSVGGLGIVSKGVFNLNNGTLELTGNMDFYDWEGAFNFTRGEIKVSSGIVTPQATTTLVANQILTVTGSRSHWNDTRPLYVNGGLFQVRNGALASGSDGYVGNASDSTGEAVVDGIGSIWTNSKELYIGGSEQGNGQGLLRITGGGAVNNVTSYIGYDSQSTGMVAVDGADSIWKNSASLYIGYKGQGTLMITDGGVVSNQHGYLAPELGSMGEVTVDGVGSMWAFSGGLNIGIKASGGGGGRAPENLDDDAINQMLELIGDESDSTWTNGGTLTITNSGLVRIAKILNISNKNGDSFINMDSGGMLALKGNADDSLDAFLGLVKGTDAIRYWDDSTSAWTALSDATYGVDYTLSYQIEGDLAGYTVLTVPEPATLLLLGLGGLIAMRHRHR